jgi:hypothetical protein
VLEPGGHPAAGQVSRVKAFGDDSLHAELGDARDEVLGPVDHDARGRAPGGSVERELLEQGSALPLSRRPGRAPVEVKQVEHLEHRRMPLSG